MKTRIVGLWILLGVVAAALAQTTGDAGWIKHSNQGGKFSVLFPVQPKESSVTENAVVIHQIAIVQPPRVYLIIYSDYPPADLKLEMSYRLKAERDGFLKGISGGRLISERELKFKRGSTELPALEFTAENNDGTYKCIVVIDGARVYLVGFGSAKGNDSTVQMERFLGSFTLD